jgi:hypothetical protein
LQRRLLVSTFLSTVNRAFTAVPQKPGPLRLSDAIACGLLALPFDFVAPGIANDDPELPTLIERLHAKL